MKKSGPIAAFLLTTAAGVAAWGGGSVDVPHRFRADTVAVADEVNQNFDAVVEGIDGNGDRIAVVEAEVFSLGSALHFLPQSNAAMALAQIAESVYVLALNGFNSGLAEAEEVCRWSTLWKNSAYLSSSDDADQLDALVDHATRTAALRDTAYLRFDVGLIPIIEVRTAEHCALSADTVAEGFAAKTGL